MLALRCLELHCPITMEWLAMRVERGTQQAAAWNNTDKRAPPPLGLLRAVGALRLGGHAVAEVGVHGAPAVDAQAGVVVKHAQVLRRWRGREGEQ